jgi:flagella synthesis protein FlgN
MTREEAVGQVLDGVDADLGACTAIRDLLERQFQAALRHHGAELAALSEELMPQLEAMEARRLQRVQLVRALGGAGATMDTWFASLDEQRRGGAQARWQRLEDLVRACKEATVRNQSLMAEQHSTMQRVLHGEEQTYAPA